MCKFWLLILLINIIQFQAKAQNVKQQLCNHAWQEKSSLIIWNFKNNGDFSAIFIWGDKKNAGFTAKKGIYSLNDSASILKLSFDSSYSVYSKDSFLMDHDNGSQEWRLISVRNNKVVISRPPLWKFESVNKVNENDRADIIVTLTGAKKKKKVLE